jgi:hypothetical protein
MRSFDTTAHHAASTRVAGSANHHSYSATVEESYSYDLWDADKTMGCKCDPAYYGADCSLKKCAYGVDPLYFDSTDGAIHQTTVVHLGSASGAIDPDADNTAQKAAISGTFKIVFYDVFGEKYVTRPISAAVGSVTPLAVQRALEALPNGVISTMNTDVTNEPNAAVDVAMHGGHSTAASPDASTLANTLGAITKTGGIGAGVPGATAIGMGLGTQTTTAARGDATGPEFTITFKSNPGILKGIEVDTREILNEGTADYWVANTRQGQFTSRYTTNLGRVNTLVYNTNKVYTNTDLTGLVTAHATTAASMTKIGGQEFRVTAASASFLTLNEPYLGATIAPTLTNTGAVASAFGAAGTPANFYDRLTIGAVTEKQVLHLSANKPLYINGCPFVAALGEDSGTNTAIAVSSTKLGIVAGSYACETSTLYASGSGNIIYRRSDDPNNQNIYKAPADTATALATKLFLTRGNSAAYLCTEVTTQSPLKAYVPAAATRTMQGAGTGAPVAGDPLFVNGIGPVTHSAQAGDTLTMVEAPAGTKKLKNLFPAAWVANTEFSLFAGLASGSAADSAVQAGTVLLIEGRRYKVKGRGSGGGLNGVSKVTLSENYAGGAIIQHCTACVKEVAQASGTITFQANEQHSFAKGERLFLQGRVHEEFASTVTTATTSANTVVVSPGGMRGPSGGINGAGNIASGATLGLYKTSSSANAEGVTVGLVTESAINSKQYNYVAQCSNRGRCDSATGLCVCFKGYSGGNCNAQNMLAM